MCCDNMSSGLTNNQLPVLIKFSKQIKKSLLLFIYYAIYYDFKKKKRVHSDI